MSCSLIYTFIFSLFCWPSLNNGQQAYTDHNCDSSAISALGYTCNGVSRTCSAYLVYRTQPSYSTLSSIASLLSADVSQVSAINNISENAALLTNNEVIIPVTCSCTTNLSQSNTTYVVQDGDNYVTIANNTYEGLTTCSAIRNEQLSPNVTNTFPNERLTIPLRSACPTKKQAGEGINYLMSSVIQPGDTIAKIATRYGADLGQTLEANNKSDQDSLIQPFTTLLVPLQTLPIAQQISVAPSRHKPTLAKPQIALLACFSAVAVGALIFLAIYLKTRYSKMNQLTEVFQPMTKQEVEGFLKNYGMFGPRRYNYAELRKITNSFGDKLGEGGYGIVYGGQLHNGHVVAVKILKKSKGTAEEFINEVSSVGKTNHKNLVTLLGFCYDSHKRALVYDFMPNGSLDKFIYGGNNHQSLPWAKLYQIAVGIARGLEYLHLGCNTRILHFDIKPHNILLDEDFCPKISDFGLAKSCPQKESIISISDARGTAGYIAPEVFLRSFGGVSQKSDVYSYGMLVLEMVGCRKNSDVQVESSSEQYFPQWIYTQMEEEDLEHPENLTSEERELQRKMVLVSFCCIQTNPQSRPTMTRVVEMLEGSLEALQMPPMPSLEFPLETLSLHNSSTAGAVSITAV